MNSCLVGLILSTVLKTLSGNRNTIEDKENKTERKGMQDRWKETQSSVTEDPIF